MPIAQDMKRLTEDIVTSYDTRIAAVGNIVAETGDLLKKFDKEHKSTSAELKRDLAHGEEERLETFKAMLKTFQKEHREMADALEKMLAASEDTRLKDFKATLSGIQKRIKEIGTEVSRYLTEVQKDMTAAGVAWQEMAGQMDKTRHGVAIKIGKGKPLAVEARAEVKTAEEAAKPRKSAKGGSALGGRGRKGRRGKK